ncbi:mono/diheme cytochrome c family protein [Rhodopseudomonas julia]|uniref:Mono/diheme cytochrome c family protein n=1 Tax=Rhodopseudomonas julia TaxID=200617 RepID=A0ABU0CAD2_9BRAD|nr:c-type cytochrome [Rhodopseudomonas julia]MDQ0326856.1 mono/diheme cytochrome c family protein [Rhodopseudomonas julia]
MTSKAISFVVLALAIVAFLAIRAFVPGNGDARIADVKVPELSSDAQTGRALFEENCVACHGESAAGTEAGPPLVHAVYAPEHHSDQAFQLAVARGVTAHHWSFGNMAPVEGLSQTEVDKIAVYVRALQRANGIM